MGKALDAYRRYRDLAARGAFDRLTEALDENWVENCLGLTGWTVGLDIALANLQAGFGQAFSDLASTEHDLVEVGDTLVIRGENSGVHTGRFLGVEPTGRRVSWEFLDMYKVGPDGRLNWHLLATDWNLVRLQLLGQAPRPAGNPHPPRRPGGARTPLIRTALAVLRYGSCPPFGIGQQSQPCRAGEGMLEADEAADVEQVQAWAAGPEAQHAPLPGLAAARRSQRIHPG
jgi:predicted ester cyclase